MKATKQQPTASSKTLQAIAEQLQALGDDARQALNLLGKLEVNPSVASAQSEAEILLAVERVKTTLSKKVLTPLTDLAELAGQKELFN